MDTKAIRTPWFDLDMVSHGIQAGTNASHQPMSLVNAGQGVFLVHETV